MTPIASDCNVAIFATARRDYRPRALQVRKASCLQVPVVETQPATFLVLGAAAGTVSARPRRRSSKDILSESSCKGADHIDNDFAELCCDDQSNVYHTAQRLHSRYGEKASARHDCRAPIDTLGTNQSHSMLTM